MKISERGQVTIPQELREKYGYLPNTDVEFIAKNGALMLIQKKSARRDALKSIYGKKKLKKSTDELMALLRDG
ncbi:MAG: AbrB/MazE/SpoVT family DNA-binding domain-containing protein [Pseudomonadota bacterium]